MRLCHVFLLSTLLGAATASLCQGKVEVVADIPFDFVAGGRTLPAGHYLLNVGHDVLGIRDRQNHGSFVPTHSAQRPLENGESKLVFHRLGDVYFLAEVWSEGKSIGREVFPSPKERKLSESGKERVVAVVKQISN